VRMADVALTEEIELRAAQAEDLPAFRGVKVLYLKQEIAAALQLIGRAMLFEEYTKHDVTHLDAMLRSLNWLIPAETKTRLTPADCLLISLSTYLHDLGMLVTQDEYNHRHDSSFPVFTERLYDDEATPDYLAKLHHLAPDRRERFLYQEFVRRNHAYRIRSWILGDSTSAYGAAEAAAAEVNRILTPLSDAFRHDLAIVCESHHLSDLDNFDKYKTYQAYGQSPEEAANVHYAALLLRLSDLLHITSDRVPSVEFRLINPSDPLSQEEWAKQRAVTAVKDQLGRDANGNLDPTVERDTIEVYAYFKHAAGFFSLIQYLRYVDGELKRIAAWAQTAQLRHASTFELPWRHIDDSKIETEGFLPRTFAFELDQNRLLELLTGHTLYNDTSVVVRELVQNALDAIRFRRVESPEEPFGGLVRVEWDSHRRELSVQDNGTGMSQDVIEKHFLTVGSSRYQEPGFKKRFPDFSAISRFGIGVLSTFMIADAVEVVTCAPEDDDARLMLLQSVHGRYLVRLLDKASPQARSLAPRGTVVRLTVRHGAAIPDLKQALREWVVLPGCRVELGVDGRDPELIGYPTVRDALAAEAGIAQLPLSSPDPGEPARRIVEVGTDTLDLAFVAEWDGDFREWRLAAPGRDADEKLRDGRLLLGTCVEGIRVERGPPGFLDANILALANLSGDASPKTDVARSKLENTAERAEMLRSVYGAYCAHVCEELDALVTDRGFSETWAASASAGYLRPLWRAGAQHERATPSPVDRDLLKEAIEHIPLLLVEENGVRRRISVAQLDEVPEFWTVDALTFRFAESLIREVPELSLDLLGRSVDSDRLTPPLGMQLCREELNDLWHEFVGSKREVVRIELKGDERRVDLLWRQTSELEALWWQVEWDPEWYRQSSFVARGGELFVGQKSLTIGGRVTESAVRAFGNTYLLWDTALAGYMRALRDRCDAEESSLRLMALSAARHIVLGLLEWGDVSERFEEIIETYLTHVPRHAQRIKRLLDLEEVRRVAGSDPLRVFDTSRWIRERQA
jgi:molecular chaperone HtpG